MSSGSCGQCGRTLSSCGCDQKFTLPTQTNILGMLIPDLTCVVDQIRDLYTCLGARQYTVSLVWERWSGGERGVGYPDVVHSEVILPTPLVVSLTALNNSIESVGLTEVGGIRVSEISPRYTEDFLMGRSRIIPDGEKIPDDVNFYYEIKLLSSGVSRRFLPKSAPSGTTALDFEWSIDLIRAQDDPTRSYPL